MPTQRQIAANRRNAQKSTGPKTPEGKQTVSRNAIRHGLLATSSTLIGGEDPAELEELTLRLHEEYRPVGVMEEMLVTRITSSLWRLQRIAKIEAGAFLPVALPESLPNVFRMEPNPHAAPDGEEARWEEANSGAVGLERAFSARTQEFEQLQRYEAHLDRLLRRTIEELERRQYARIHNVDPYYLAHMRRFPPVSDQSEAGTGGASQGLPDKETIDSAKQSQFSDPPRLLQFPDSPYEVEASGGSGHPGGTESQPAPRAEPSDASERHREGRSSWQTEGNQQRSDPEHSSQRPAQREIRSKANLLLSPWPLGEEEPATQQPHGELGENG